MQFIAPLPINTTRLTIRIVERRDLPALMYVNGDEQVTRFLPYKTWQSFADAEVWYERMTTIQASGTALQFVVVERQTDTAIGGCSLFRYDADNGRVELGYVLRRSYWGLGYMREALRALIGHVFGTMMLRRIEAEVDPTNSASTGLLEKLGFIKEGVLRQHWIANQQPVDAVIYGLLKNEYCVSTQ